MEPHTEQVQVAMNRQDIIDIDFRSGQNSIKLSIVYVGLDKCMKTLGHCFVAVPTSIQGALNRVHKQREGED